MHCGLEGPSAQFFHCLTTTLVFMPFSSAFSDVRGGILSVYENAFLHKLLALVLRNFVANTISSAQCQELFYLKIRRNFRKKRSHLGSRDLKKKQQFLGLQIHFRDEGENLFRIARNSRSVRYMALSVPRSFP